MKKNNLPKIYDFGTSDWILWFLIGLIPFYNGLKCITQFEEIKYLYNTFPDQYSKKQYYQREKHYKSAKAFIIFYAIITPFFMFIVFMNSIAKTL